MLQKLLIRNYAIIDELTITFDEHLNVITGETGAGKSIILGAISLILGERADTSVLINVAEKCIVEAHFDTAGNAAFTQLLQEQELDIEPITIIRREISTSGKSRAFVNDTPVTLTILNELTSTLVDLHRQFDNRSLDDSGFMYAALDAVAETQTLATQYQNAFEDYKLLQKQYQQLLQDQAAWQKEADYNQFLFDELEAADFKEQEIESLETQLKQLSNAELIKNTLSEGYMVLAEGEQPLTAEIKRIVQQLQHIIPVYPDAHDIATRLNSAYEELKDLANELSHLQEAVDLDAGQLQEMQERLDLGNRLLKKHALSDTEALRAVHQQLAGILSAQQQADTTLEQLKAAISQSEAGLEKQAQSLFKQRIAKAPVFAKDINELLQLIGMPNAAFKIELQPATQFNAFGKDSIQYLLDANKSGKFATVQKAASGGELSRIMLSIKTLTAKALQLPTLIFDEVDTGISGEAAKQVGILLRSLGAYHQVLCITHQPQVAGKGHKHFYVYKAMEQGKINTRIKALDMDERIQLIAQMIGGEQPSEAALNNAKELVTVS
ncbi:DNA repair protein RecN [Taibaiella sp. KBW10]|uniref:DNA repair protein RecN n=1 Tax=Taibaiella sp. KBW10 TaxID=2153357 RepID=UPI000F5959EB|nr:DNA repair protein RecN [Taibaiella sp. KBW10]RQO31077.1 DNA repair protein RecN [Taibaiella sp. KBW10]